MLPGTGEIRTPDPLLPKQVRRIFGLERGKEGAFVSRGCVFLSPFTGD